MKIQNCETLKLKKSVVALGKFEGLHLGHMLLIDRVTEISKDKGLTSVICSINLPGKEHINTTQERYSILENKGIDVVANCEFNREFASLTPEAFFEGILVDRLNARYIVVGSDFRFGCNRIGDTQSLIYLGKKHNITIVVIDKMSIDGKIISTSYIKELITGGDMQAVSRLMGRPYSITGDIVRGKQLGRTIGFPTINIIPDQSKLLPRFGVYETSVTVEGKTYVGITNVGNNPTIDASNKTIIETNIPDFQGDLYGKNAEIRFIRFVRGEKKFESIDALKEQINMDIATIMHQ